MNPKQLGSMLCLVSMSTLFTDGAIAQPDGISSASDAKAKFANDYNAGRFKDVVADEELLRKFNLLGPQNQLIIAQAYYKAGDYAGCVKYAHEHLNPPSNQTEATFVELQDRCAYEAAKAPKP